jgi:hypothetical protein
MEESTMSRISRMFPAALVAAGLLAAPQAFADNGAVDASRLGNDLTPTGAVMAGSADGRIPAWSGKWLGAPPHVDYDGRYNPDPYPDDQPLYTITAANMAEHEAHLGPGQKALFEKYPDTYRIHVYPTRRDFRNSDRTNENARLNVDQARLSNDGLTLTGAHGAVAFPMPRSGIELIYNIFTSSAPYMIESPQISAYVFANGNVSWSEIYLRVFSPYNHGSREDWDDGIYSLSISEQRAPRRDAGKVTFTTNTFDFLNQPRQGWQYDPGTRRLRRNPDVGFDFPMDTGPRVVDEQNGYNGSPERFDWQLVGQAEMVVPFNNYRLDDRNLKYADFIGTRGHPNPEHVRHELRRVWIVEGTLKPNTRHIYSKRRFYIEEDSWHKVMADQYDRRGELWRVSQDGIIYAYDAEAYYNNVSIYQDLTAGSYSIEKLNNEMAESSRLNRREPRPNEFTADGVRRGGR